MTRRTFVLAAVLGALATAAPAAAQGLPDAGCDPFDPAVCLQPWPNDYFTLPDASTPTGKRLQATRRYGTCVPRTKRKTANNLPGGNAGEA